MDTPLTIIMIALLLGSVNLSRAAADPPAMDWTANWDPQVKLWWKDGPGHSRDTKKLDRTHPVANVGSAILTACQLDQLDRIDVTSLLQIVRDKQEKNPAKSTFGNVAWYWEDQGVSDRNAGFFLGMSLSIVQLEYADRLTASQRKLLLEILRDISAGMSRHNQRPKLYYPNSYLGDLVTRWVLAESLHDEKQMAQLVPLIDELAEVYAFRGRGWGWGEDMSDIYSKILADQLSTLVVLCRKLPETTRQRCLKLLNHLMWLEDQFDVMPRVPAIRSYNFDASPRTPEGDLPRWRGYRKAVSPWDASKVVSINHTPQLGHLLAMRGWHDVVAPPAQRQRRIDVPCMNDITARAIVEDDFRIGAMSRFPIMPSADTADSGLSWQCMPVAMWHEQGDWSYLQWFVKIGKDEIAYPSSVNHKTDPLKMRYTLAPSISPPVQPRTYTLVSDAGVIVLRIMPLVTREWDAGGDRLRMINFTGQVSESKLGDDVSHLALTYPRRTVHAYFLDPWRHTGPVIVEQSENAFDWQVKLNRDSLSRREGMVYLWAFAIGKPPRQAPRIEPMPMEYLQPRSIEEKAFVLDWVWPDHHWRVRIDPLADDPLVELGADRPAP